jgi:hypothetical protein
VRRIIWGSGRCTREDCGRLYCDNSRAGIGNQAKSEKRIDQTARKSSGTKVSRRADRCSVSPLLPSGPMTKNLIQTRLHLTVRAERADCEETGNKSASRQTDQQ